MREGVARTDELGRDWILRSSIILGEPLSDGNPTAATAALDGIVEEIEPCPECGEPVSRLDVWEAPGDLRAGPIVRFEMREIVADLEPCGHRQSNVPGGTSVYWLSRSVRSGDLARWRVTWEQPT